MDLITFLFLVCAIISTIFAILQYKKSKQQRLQLKVINNYFPDISLEFLPQSEKELNKKIEKRYGFIREDLLEKEFYVASPIARYNIIIKKLNKYLDKEDINILIATSAVCRAQDEEKHSLAKQLHVSLVDVYGNRGKKIYNMLNTNVFEENILPYLGELEEFLPKDILRISKMLQEYFDSIIKHGVVNRLWVSGGDNYDSVLSRIKERFWKFNDLRILNIYARKELNVTFTEMACIQFITENKEKFDWKKLEEKKLRGRIATTFKIIRKSAK